jgi:hypothetical protein
MRSANLLNMKIFTDAPVPRYVSGCCDLARNSTIEISTTSEWNGQEVTVVITPL